ncbi:unnamed protein product [Arctogadus glacialis]
MTSQVDLDMVNLRLILVSGKTEDFTFSPNDSATDIAKHVFDNWPAGWEEEQVSSPSILRLIFQGRFLHGNVTLGALKLPPGRTTVMHLVARETLPEPNSHGQRNREKTTESNCCLLLFITLNWHLAVDRWKTNSTFMRTAIEMDLFHMNIDELQEKGPGHFQENWNGDKAVAPGLKEIELQF